MASGEPPVPSPDGGLYAASRRSFISRYLKYLGGNATDKWDDCLRLALETTMETLKEKGFTHVSHCWLGHEADRVAWDKLFRSLDIDAVEWPFTAQGNAPDEIATGVSPTYQKWRLDRGLPVSDSTKFFGSVKATVLSLSQREIVWDNSSNYPPQPEAPITGPFQFALPVWIDIDNLFFGKNNHLLDMINNEIIPPHLAVSWHNEDEGCVTVVVGFSPTTCIEPVDEQVEPSIRYLWQSVIAWAFEAYYGGTMTLATFLRVRKAVPVAYDADCSPWDIIDMASEIFDDAREDVLGFMRRAQEKRDYIAQCRAEVLEIIQKPLTEAKAELSRWVCQGSLAFDYMEASGDDQRLEAAREIWVSSTTDERTIQEACIWAWGPHDMAV
ncbi:hypothetical protein FOXYS1_3212 [Fusarium oxysporum]|uniref:Uncharacterized protein n=1 Tax=Fusarium oxysporum TaxID=5507 RepID=A0A8H5EMP4_FUSOX|nr:hypothetical protein FOXYS1_3212 [Fusarium oxysporum]